MQSFEEAATDIEDSAREFMTQLAHRPVAFDAPMPSDLPPVAQRLWAHCQGILRELNSDEFEEIEW
jgi:hypothetical protein